jgi:Tol biopolymer transport system component
VVFTRYTGRSFDIFVASPDGSNVVNLTNTDDYHEDIASWSPGGDRIAFVRNPTSAPDERQLYIMQADGTEVEQVTSLPGPNSNPIWLDATTLVFAHQVSGAVRQPYLVRLPGDTRPLSASDERVWFMSRFDVGD